MSTDVIERRRERFGREPSPAGPNHLAAEAKTAIDRARIHKLEQHAIGIAVDDPLDWAEGAIANRIGVFFRPSLQFSRVGDELPRNWIVRVCLIDQRGNSRRNSYRIARRHVLKRGKPVSPDQACIGEIGWRAQGFWLSGIHGGLGSIVHAPYA